MNLNLLPPLDLLLSLLAIALAVGLGLALHRLSRERSRSRILEGRVSQEREHRQATEAALEAAHERFTQVFQFLPELVTLTSLDDTRLMDMNRNWTPLLGYSREQGLGRSSIKLGIWQRPEDKSEIFAELATGLEVHDRPVTLLHHDGHAVNTLVSARLLHIGGHDCVLAVFRDITEQVRLERAERAAAEAQRISEAMFSAAFHGSPDYITISRVSDGKILEVNHAFAQLVGWSRAEAIGVTSVELGLWPIPEERIALVDLVVEHGALRNYPCTIGTRHQGQRHCLINASTVRIEGQDCLIAIVRDVTEQKAAADALQESQARFAAIFASAPVAMSLTRIDDRTHVDANPAWERLFGLDRTSVLERSTGELGFWVDQDVYDGLYARIARDEIVEQQEVRIRPRGRGEIATCLVSGCRLRIRGEDCGLWSLADITELRRVQGHIEELNEGLERRVAERTAELRAALETLHQARDELVRSEKLAALGSLVAGIAHELNTPIGNSVTVATTLAARTTDMAREHTAGTLRRAHFDNFVASALQASELLMRNLVRAQELVRSFKQVAVDQASEVRRPFELGEVLREIAMTLRPMFHTKPYEMEIDCAEPVLMDSYPGALGQILTNLVTNALIHGLEGRPQGRIQVVVHPGADSVGIRICDDGAGIAESALPRIFDPFFTTRLGEGGSGLGLYIVYNLVTRSLGGQISATSEPGKGTCFRLSLPRTAPSADAPKDALAIPSRSTPGLNFEAAGPIN